MASEIDNPTQALTVTEPTPLTVGPPTPMTLLTIAMNQGADLDKLSKLMDLQERWEKNEARKAYVTAMNGFKSNPPELRKNKHVKFGNTEYDHATLDNVVDTIVAGLSRHGLSHSWKVEQSAERIRVTCVITHELGHSESVTLESGADSSGSKNSIQAIASAVTYLQRYTLLSATGMAAKGIDNDGAGASGMDGREVGDWIDSITASSTPDELKRNYTEAYKAASAAKDKSAQAAFIKAKDARKAEL